MRLVSLVTFWSMCSVLSVAWASEPFIADDPGVSSLDSLGGHGDACEETSCRGDEDNARQDILGWKLGLSCEVEHTYQQETPPYPGVYTYWCAYSGQDDDQRQCWYQSPTATEASPPATVELEEDWNQTVHIVQLPSLDGYIGESFCMVDPQDQSRLGCWHQESDPEEPVVPEFLTDSLGCNGRISTTEPREAGRIATASR